MSSLSSARFGAGVFAALSRRSEGDRPGALAAAAADMLARSAQKADHREHRRSDRAGLVTVAAQAALVRRGAGHGAAGWLLVAAELLRLAQAIERAHAARWGAGRAQDLTAGRRRRWVMIGHEGEKNRWRRQHLRRRRHRYGDKVPTEGTSGGNVSKGVWGSDRQWPGRGRSVLFRDCPDRWRGH